MNTPQESNEVKFNSSENFKIKTDKESEMKLKISYNEKLIYFEAKEENIFPKMEYSLYQSLEELCRLDKYFRQFDEIKEVFDFIKIIINKNKLSIISEENDVKLKINLINKDIILKLCIKEKDVKSEVESLIPYIASLNKKINDLEDTIKNMKIEFDNKLNEMKKEMEKKFEKKCFFEGSYIIQIFDENLILSWFDKKPISIKLLLNAEINGDFLSQFINICSNIKNTMIFVKTTDNLIFGGFTSVVWPTNGKADDSKSFLFSLTNKAKYKVINTQYAIGVSQNSYISFGYGNDFYLYKNLKGEGGGTCKCYYDLPESYTLNGGKNRFKITNCEIFQINF